jgi:hypothetical protein
MRIQLCLCSRAVFQRMLSRYIVLIMARCSDIGKRDGRLGCGRGSYFSRNSAKFSDTIGVLRGPLLFDAGNKVFVDIRGTAGWLFGDDAAGDLPVARASTSEALLNNFILMRLIVR